MKYTSCLLPVITNATKNQKFSVSGLKNRQTIELARCHGYVIKPIFALVRNTSWFQKAFLPNQYFLKKNRWSAAKKTSMPGSSVSLAADQANQEIVISVKDQGSGFSTQYLKKVFQKFQRLSARPTAGEKSLGLRLSSVRSLMEKLGGEIELISEAGKSSVFFLRFKQAGLANKSISNYLFTSLKPNQSTQTPSMAPTPLGF